MELTRLLILLFIISLLGHYAFEYQANREETLQRQEELRLIERQR